MCCLLVSTISQLLDGVTAHLNNYSYPRNTRLGGSTIGIVPQGLVQAAKHSFVDMVFTKNRGNNDAIERRVAKKKKKIPDDPVTETPCSAPNRSGTNVMRTSKTKVTSSLISPPPAARKQAPKNRKSFISGSLGVNELLQVFLELEGLDDKHLRPAVVHGRKKLKALAYTGFTVTEFVDVILQLRVI